MPYKNPEDKQECKRRYYARNKHKILFHAQTYYKQNKEEIKARQRKYNFTAKAKISERNSLFRKHHPFKELMRAVNANSKKRGHPERIGYMDLYRLAKKQKCRCALTGDKLTRDNISVDHITPLSKGGNNVVENLRLVTYDVNIVKNSLSDLEFLTICKNVVRHNENHTDNL
jgi:5-methylcytosine-specific restriction endonuclease McrA